MVTDLDMGLDCNKEGREHREMQRDENIEGIEVQKCGGGERGSERQMYKVERRDKRNWSNGQLERVRCISCNTRKPLH